MSYCNKCYKRLAYNTVYCYHCGAKNKIRKKVTRVVRTQLKPANGGLLKTIFNFFSKEDQSK